MAPNMWWRHWLRSHISCMGLWGIRRCRRVAAKEKGDFLPICHKSFTRALFVFRILRMDKKELMDRICEINTTAKTEFLSQFSEEDLTAYLDHLMELNLEELAVCS